MTEESKTPAADSPTKGMTLAQRVAHVGGRINAQGYVEFGSEMAVDALIQQILRDQCKAEGVPFLFKQWGEWVPMTGHTEGVPVNGKKHTFPDGTIMGRAGKSAAGRLLNGIEHNGFPEAS